MVTFAQGESPKQKCPKKWKKSTIFLTAPPLPQDILDFFEFEKNWKFEFCEPPLRKNISRKHLKLPKNHFKTNLFFLQLKYLKSTFTFGKKMKIYNEIYLIKEDGHPFSKYGHQPSP